MFKKWISVIDPLNPALFFLVLFSNQMINAADTETQKLPCGITGSVAERIQDCKNWTVTPKAGFTWTLVTRTQENIQVWRDDTTGLLWGDTLIEVLEPIPNDPTGRKYGSLRWIFNFKEARRLCSNPRFQKFNGNIDEAIWRLPGIELFEDAETRRIRSLLPNTDYRFFWSATPHEVEMTEADGWPSWSGVGFRCQDGKRGADDKRRDYFVRCVGSQVP